MQRIETGRHLADTRAPSTGVRTAQFLKLARQKRETFPSRHAPTGTSRLVQFMRIARGRTA